MQYFDEPEEESDIFARFNKALSKVQNETNLSKNEILSIFEKKHDDFLPASVFCNRKLGILETVVKFLKEEHDYTLSKIARLLNRDNRTIWSTYDSARKKEPNRLVSGSTEHIIPLKIFSNRKLGALEVLVKYLRENYDLRYSDIACITQRDPRTIWTVYSRAKKK